MVNIVMMMVLSVGCCSNSLSIQTKREKKIKKKKALAEAKGENSQLYNGTSLEQNRYTETLKF